MRGDIRKADRLDRIHLDLTFFHTVSLACRDVGARPNPNTAGDLAPTNSIAKSLGKRHETSVHAASADEERATTRVDRCGGADCRVIELGASCPKAYGGAKFGWIGAERT